MRCAGRTPRVRCAIRREAVSPVCPDLATAPPASLPDRARQPLGADETAQFRPDRHGVDLSGAARPPPGIRRTLHSEPRAPHAPGLRQARPSRGLSAKERLNRRRSPGNAPASPHQRLADHDAHGSRESQATHAVQRAVPANATGRSNQDPQTTRPTMSVNHAKVRELKAGGSRGTYERFDDRR